MVVSAAVLGNAELGAHCVAWCLGHTHPQEFQMNIFPVPPGLQGDVTLEKKTCLELHAFPELENISCSMSPGTK